MERGDLLRDCGEKADDHTNRRSLHFVAELVHVLSVLRILSGYAQLEINRISTYIDAVVAIKLHLLPYS